VATPVEEEACAHEGVQAILRVVGDEGDFRTHRLLVNPRLSDRLLLAPIAPT